MFILHLLVLASTVTGCVLISSFSSLLCVHVGIASSEVGVKLVKSLQEFKRISQLSRKGRRSMINSMRLGKTK